MHLLQVNSNHIFGAQSFYAVVFDIFWPKGGRNKANIFINIIVIIVLCQRKCKKKKKTVPIIACSAQNMNHIEYFPYSKSAS